MHLIILIILVVSCSGNKKNQKRNGHFQLYSEPGPPKLLELGKDEKRIVIASTNDIKAHYEPLKIHFNDKHHNNIQEIQIGGETVISKYYDILRSTYENVILLDSGNIFSTDRELDDVKKFYERNGYTAATLGVGDFNLNNSSHISTLVNKFGDKSKVPLMISNLFELKTARTVEWKGTKSHMIKSIDGINVGIIGLIPDDVAEQSPVKNRVGIYVESMVQSTLRHARLLRSLGADIIVVLTHQSLDCISNIINETQLPREKVNFDPLYSKACNLENELGEYMQRLPPKLVDIIIGGRSGDKMANFVNGLVILGGFPEGKAFNFSEFVINIKTRKLVTTKTVIHQPVYFCHDFFKESNDCFPHDKSVDHKIRTKAHFLGKVINP